MTEIVGLGELVGYVGPVYERIGYCGADVILPNGARIPVRQRYDRICGRIADPQLRAAVERELGIGVSGQHDIVLSGWWSKIKKKVKKVARKVKSVAKKVVKSKAFQVVKKIHKGVTKIVTHPAFKGALASFPPVGTAIAAGIQGAELAMKVVEAAKKGSRKAKAVLAIAKSAAGVRRAKGPAKKAAKRRVIKALTAAKHAGLTAGSRRSAMDLARAATKNVVKKHAVKIAKRKRRAAAKRAGGKYVVTSPSGRVHRFAPARVR